MGIGIVELVLVGAGLLIGGVVFVGAVAAIVVAARGRMPRKCPHCGKPL